MKLQQLLSYTRKAVDEYQMIQPGDKIAVGISGGKDSLTMLYALHGLRRFYPNHFDLHAITVSLGYEGFDLSPVRALCEELEVPVLVDFWAEWCGPCRMVLPIIEELSEELTDVKVGKVNVDEQPELAMTYKIMTIPTLMVFRNGEVADKAIGGMSKAEILEMLK